MDQPEPGSVKLVGSGLAMIAGTIFAIFAMSTDWSSAKYGFDIAASDAQRWPWLRGSITLTLVNCMVPFVTAWYAKSEHQFDNEIVVYALGLIWVPLLCFYPGTAALGRWSDGSGGWTLVLIMIVQDLGIWRIARSVKRVRWASPTH